MHGSGVPTALVFTTSKIAFYFLLENIRDTKNQSNRTRKILAQRGGR